MVLPPVEADWISLMVLQNLLKLEPHRDPALGGTAGGTHLIIIIMRGKYRDIMFPGA